MLEFDPAKRIKIDEVLERLNELAPEKDFELSKAQPKKKVEEVKQEEVEELMPQ